MKLIPLLVLCTLGVISNASAQFVPKSGPKASPGSDNKQPGSITPSGRPGELRPPVYGTPAMAQELSEDPEIADRFYRGYLESIENSDFKALIQKAAQSPDPVGFIDNYVAKYNANMEKKFADAGVTFKFSNAGTALDKTLFYMEMYRANSSKTRRVDTVAKNLDSNASSRVDMAGIPELTLNIVPDVQAKIRKYASGKLDAAYDTANSNRPWAKYETKDREFSLPVANPRDKIFKYDNVKVDASYSLDANNQVIVKLRVSKDLSADDIAKENYSKIEDFRVGSTFTFVQDGFTRIYRQLYSPADFANDSKKDKWDFSKSVANLDGSVHLENTITYEIKDSAQAQEFKKLIAAGPFTIRGMRWDESDPSNLKFAVPSVNAAFDTAKPYLIVDSKQEARSVASPNELKSEQYKGSKFIGVPAMAEYYMNMAKYLIALKKKGELSAALPANDILKDIGIDILPRRDCHA